MRTSDTLRIGDAERDAAIAELSRHFADGRLTQAEHEERMTLALAARTGGDLRRLFADLPRLDVVQPAPKQPVRAPLRLVIQPVLSALMIVAGIFLLLHLVSVFVLIAFAFVAARLVFGTRRLCRRAAGSSRSGGFPRGGGGFYGRW